MQSLIAYNGLAQHSKFATRLVKMFISWYTKKIFGVGPGARVRDLGLNHNSVVPLLIIPGPRSTKPL